MTIFALQRHFYRLLLVLSVVSLLIGTLPTLAQEQPPKHLIPIGGGYSDIYAGFSKEAVANARNNQVKILVLPMASSSNAETISDAERAANLKDAEERRFQIEEACKRAAPPTVTCTAILAPIFTHSDATDPNALKYFTDDVTAVFILGGDQAIAMQVMGNTPIELSLATAYKNGTLIAGTSGGGGMQSAAMLAGYNLGYTTDNSLNFGASDVWNTPEKHGLSFSLPNAILDEHFYQRGNLGRLLNAIALPDAPHVGIGVDAYTGVNVYDETRLQDVFGLYVATLLDGETYHAADSVRYSGPQYTVGLRNVLVQVLAPGKFSYDLDKRVMSIGDKAQPPKAKLARNFNALTLPKGAGPLILSGDLSESLNHNRILERFVALAGGSQANLLIVAAGYPSASSAQTAADKYAEALGVPSKTFVVSDAEPLTIPAGMTGLLLIAKDQSRVTTSLLEPIKAAWLGGLPVLADNGGAAVAGQAYSAHGPTPSDPDEAEFAVQKSFLQGTTKIFDGLGLLNITVEPQLLNDNRWGRLFSLAYNQPDRLAVGLTQNSGLELTRTGARTIGDNALVTLDLRNATLDLGTNNGFVIANGLLDVFGPDDAVKSVNADMKAAPTRIATPNPPTFTPTPTATSTPTITPTPLPPTLTPSATPTITPTPTRTSTPTRTPVPDAVTVAITENSPIIPIALVAGIVFFAVVLIAGRRRT